MKLQGDKLFSIKDRINDYDYDLYNQVNDDFLKNDIISDGAIVSTIRISICVQVIEDNS